MATDIAFVVGIMALFGSRLPAGFKVFMLSLAIIDDILAVIVIAAVFTAELAPLWLVGAGLGLAMVASLNRLGVRRIGVYVLVGAFVWLCTLKSGIHPTVAGAILGLMTPAAAWLTPGQLVDRMRTALPRLETVASQDAASSSKTAPDPDYRDLVQQVDFTATESVSPLERIEHALHPWVGFVIMPLFALANAGVPVSLDGLGEPVSLSIALALFIGKPVGIVLASWLVVKTKLARLPSGVGWGMLTAGGSLAGIGFTMALFVASLSSQGATLEAAKAGILMGSLASMIVGSGLLYLATRTRAAPPA
jgi:NhaA family Na+:H+ antiporter